MIFLIRISSSIGILLYFLKFDLKFCYNIIFFFKFDLHFYEAGKLRIFSNAKRNILLMEFSYITIKASYQFIFSYQLAFFDFEVINNSFFSL